MVMIEGLFNQPNYVATKKLMDATMMRHEAIASNLANIETPGYRRLDLAPSFQSQLNQAMESRSPAKIACLRPQLAVDATAIARGRDGNTVQLENELMQMNQNTLTHAVGAQMLTSSMARLRMAITGRSA
jgi:flagellar basal-body rod protein FlgB